LIEEKYASSRDQGMELGTALVEAKKLHHVGDQHGFKVNVVM
jgi:hypothetical protein